MKDKLKCDLAAAIKALNIYDDCMNELSFFVGNMRGRCTDACHDQAISVCAKAMQAQRILHKIDNTTRAMQNYLDGV